MPTLFGRSVHFRASHFYRLSDLSESENLRLFGSTFEPHFHDWCLTVWIKGSVDPRTGMLLDLPALDLLLKDQIQKPLSGKCINDTFDYFADHLPTTENLASFFYNLLEPLLKPLQLVKVRIAEDPNLFAEYMP